MPNGKRHTQPDLDRPGAALLIVLALCGTVTAVLGPLVRSLVPLAVLVGTVVVSLIVSVVSRYRRAFSSAALALLIVGLLSGLARVERLGNGDSKIVAWVITFPLVAGLTGALLSMWRKTSLERGVPSRSRRA
jgi:hypothetical protein